MKKETVDGIETPAGSIDPEVIGYELLKADVVRDLRGFRLEPIPRNPERRDYLKRASFRVSSGDRAVCHLTVGRNLEELWRRTGEFAAACPDISARPLFLHRTQRVDYLGLEYIDGADFETLVLQGQLDVGRAKGLVGKLVSALENTLQDSTPAAASAELEAMFTALCDSPVFSGLDQRFLQEFLFPFIRKGALTLPAQTRWTNGDFIPRNIRIDGLGRPRLVDYEFACRTHFYGEDAWRWPFFSQELPPRIRGIMPFAGPPYARNEWLEAYSLLRQMHLSAETNGSVVTIADAAYGRNRLLQLISSYHKGFRSSLFLNPIFAQLSEAREDISNSIAQIFWSADGTFGEGQSCRLQVPHDKDTLLSFKLTVQDGPLNIRFDPIDAAGVVHISALRVYVPQTKHTLLALSGQTGWQSLKTCAGLLRLPDTPELNLLSGGNDPILLLPPLEISVAEKKVAVDVRMRFTRRLEGLSPLLTLAVQQEIALIGDSKAINSELATLKGKSARDSEESQRIVSELAESRSSLRQIEQNAHELAVQLASKTAEVELLKKQLGDALARGETDAELRVRKDGELATAAQKLVMWEAKIKHATEQLETLEGTMADLRCEAHRRAQAGRDLEAQLDSKTAEAQLLQTRLTEVLALAHAEVELRLRKEGELTMAEQTLVDRQDEIERAASQLSILEATVVDLRSEAHRREQAGRELEAQVATTAQTLIAKEAEIAKAAGQLVALEAIVADLRSEIIVSQETSQEALQCSADEVSKLTADNRDYAKSLQTQDHEIRQLKEAINTADQALLELRTRISAAEQWLGELRNRGLVRISLAIHREKWPL